jgi:hypothetical protein
MHTSAAQHKWRKKRPTKCSGLEIKQYSEASMSGRFEIAFDRIKSINEDHINPALTQDFMCLIRPPLSTTALQSNCLHLGNNNTIL